MEGTFLGSKVLRTRPPEIDYRTPAADTVRRRTRKLEEKRVSQRVPDTLPLEGVTAPRGLLDKFLNGERRANRQADSPGLRVQQPTELRNKDVAMARLIKTTMAEEPLPREARQSIDQN